jgi:hypothetical protein
MQLPCKCPSGKETKRNREEKNTGTMLDTIILIGWLRGVKGQSEK